MTVDLSAPLRHAHPCPKCKRTVRTVELTTGGWILINEDPSPTGNIIPWPSEHPNGAAQARIMDPPIPSDTRWDRHLCRIN